MRAEGLERGFGALEGEVKMQTEEWRRWEGRVVEGETDEVGE